MHTVAVIALHGVVPGDLCIPCDTFSRARAPGVLEPYRVRVCGEARDIKAGLFDVRVQWRLKDVAGADTVIVRRFTSRGDVSWQDSSEDQSITVVHAGKKRIVTVQLRGAVTVGDEIPDN